MYLGNGQQVTVIQKLDEGYLVCKLYQWSDPDEEPSEYRDEVFVVPEVFEEAPTVRLDKRVAVLEGMVATLEAQRAALESRIAEVNRDEKVRFARFEKFKPLHHLEDFIEGRITHYAEIPTYWGQPRIFSFSDTADKDTRGKYKLLTLFGDSGGCLEWRLSSYRDGSGSSVEVVPCFSYEEAHAAIQERIADKARASADRPQEAVVAAAKTFKVEIAPDYINKVLEARATTLQQTIESKHQELEKMRSALREIQSTGAAAGLPTA